MASQIILKCFVLLPIIINNINGQLVNCNNASCYCPSTLTTGESCILDCGAENICKEGILNCRNGDSCEIRCNGKESCSNTIINANNATDLTVICLSESSCTNNMNIICGSGDCQLKCYGFNSCANLSYSSTVIHNIPQTETSWIISNITANPTAFIILLACACCGVVIASSAVNWFCYYQSIKKQKNKMITTEVQSKSVISPSVMPLSLTAITNETSSSFGVVHLNPMTDNGVLTPNAHPLSYSHRNSQVHINFTSESNQSMKRDSSTYSEDKSVDIDISPSIGSIDDNSGASSVSTNFPTLPLSTKHNEFEIYIKNLSLNLLHKQFTFDDV